MPAFLIASGVLGLLIGSFLNVVVHRVPAGLSVVRPGSCCPSCEESIRSLDNVPVFSWVRLRGRCRHCAVTIPVRYPLVELATGLVFTSVAAVTGPTPYLPALWLIAAAGIAHLLIDLEHQRLPFSITAVAALGGAILLAVDVAVRGATPIPVALLSSLVWFGVYGGVWLLTVGRGMGLGDVALAPVLGLMLGWLGWGPGLVGLLAGFVVGAAVGVALVAFSGAGRRSRIPHGPFMITGAALGLVGGQTLWHAYLGVTGLA